MNTATWVLTDTSAGIFHETLTVGPRDVGGTRDGYEVRLQTLRGGRQDGVQLLTLSTGELQVDLIPTRGMGIWQARLGENRFGWQSPVRGPVHPAFVPLFDPSGLGWLEGFDELLARCGLESNGAPEFDAHHRLVYPLHGRIANLPAHHLSLHIDGETGTLQATGVVDESRFHFTKLRLTSSTTVTADSPWIEIRDTVENFSDRPSEFQLLYHVNFGPPLLEEGSRLILPARNVVPRTELASRELSQWAHYGPPVPGSEERVYFMEVDPDNDHWCQAELQNADNTLAATVAFDTRQLPCFSQWKNPAGLADGYVTGLEPGTNYPNPRSEEERNGRTVKLNPGEAVTFHLRLGFRADR